MALEPDEQDSLPLSRQRGLFEPMFEAGKEVRHLEGELANANSNSDEGRALQTRLDQAKAHLSTIVAELNAQAEKEQIEARRLLLEPYPEARREEAGRLMDEMNHALAIAGKSEGGEAKLTMFNDFI